MNRRVAIIDIGSNSARLVIFERSSKFGFHLISEQKSKVRIGEGAYQKDGYLQPAGVTRAFLTLQSFVESIDRYCVDEVFCIATSALRDAPNRFKFISWIKESLGLEIKIISGNEEAFYGAVATINLLPITDGITIDIGGGSSDLSLIKNSKVIDSFSLNLGTVRLKELFFDKNRDISKAKKYISKELKKIPKRFKNDIAIGLGGTIRALSRAIMIQSNYPFKKLHAFSYKTDEYEEYFKSIIESDYIDLEKLNIKENRFDTIREGTLIFVKILSSISAKNMITSGVGIREGVFLSNMLQNYNYNFPDNLNPSLVSMQDRFDNTNKNYIKMISSTVELFTLLNTNLNIESDYRDELISAILLSNIGKSLTIYNINQHAFYIASQELNYKYTHSQIILISMLLLINGKDIKKIKLYKTYKSLLPQKKILKLLNFVYSTIVNIYDISQDLNIEFKYLNKTLYISSDKSLYLVKETLQKIAKPKKFEIEIEDVSKIPSINSIIKI